MPEEDTATALRPGAEFDGLLVLPAAGRIDGRLRGEVLALRAVWVGERGCVEADLEADEVVVEGRVDGHLRARHAIALGPTAVVHGDLEAPRIRVAEGAVVNGRCRSGGPAATAAAP